MLKHPLHSDADALGRRTTSYTANELNQYSQRTVPGVKELAGTALADATVTVNELPTIRFSPWWRHAMAPDNPGLPSPGWPSGTSGPTGKDKSVNRGCSPAACDLTD